MKHPSQPASFSIDLPPIPDPKAYEGLYVYDFGTHVAVGYTAAEITLLRESEDHRNGKAYEIYRVDERGTFELKGVSDLRWGRYEAICFLRAESDAARRDFESLRSAADQNPLPCACELQLTRIDAFDPPHAAALCYPASAATMVARWLGQLAVKPGDQVVGGGDVHATVAASHESRIDLCRLPVLPIHHDRPPEEVLRTVDEPLQR